MAPPILGRYQGQPGMPPFANSQQQRQLQHRPQPLGTSGLAAPAVGAHLAFSNADVNLNLFTHAGGGGGGSNGNAYANGFGGMAGGGTGLGSHAAQMGFAHGAALQRQEASESSGVGQSEWKGMAKGRIRDVWRGNLAQEMAVLRMMVEKYPYISMVCLSQGSGIPSARVVMSLDVHFPGRHRWSRERLRGTNRTSC